MIKVGIVGGTGYTGVELLRLLARHPQVSLSVITSRGANGQRVDEMFPNLRGCVDLAFTEPDPEALAGCDVVFFATPNGIAMNGARELLEAGVRVVDLAADFRIRDIALWERWYGMTHASPDLVAEAVYGLPEINRAAIAGARLVANPGCHVTAVTLGLLPLVRSGWIDTTNIIADSKSGVSGAGRKAEVHTLMAEAGESFRAYAVAGHRHQPEIRQVLEGHSGRAVGLTFVPHLVPMVRGIEATMYARLNTAAGDLQALFEDFYAGEPFVDVMPKGSLPETRSVRGSNFCRLAIHRPQDGETAVVLSVIDNLVKGAAGQAVQNMNIMFGLPEDAGLDVIGLLP
ncbi:MAG: N-acetyl-gamma-glutamyl-phosphate reductase [Halothiobacillaceae bacterium]|jgi:N-acetyl-gamma-glutamyl-phosphate reductase|nr:N-acetyl-gamma-glutamyl-phosphate reductase [Halothiobacillaceae bacterium]MDY0049876.1 N-acetyl-gamma-glutamyl-phosphate reductase [Halothiobacillaceae bacterium]